MNSRTLANEIITEGKIKGIEIYDDCEIFVVDFFGIIYRITFGKMVKIEKEQEQ